MRHFKSSDGNILKLLDSQSIDSQQVPSHDHKLARAIQMHSSLVQRLALDTVMEGHQGCVNAITWNSEGSMLLSGSDDTRVNLWDYSNRRLVHSVDSGHSANIFCVKFVPETCDDVVVSGAGDAEVRVHRLSRSNSGSPPPHFRCHTRRVKKLAVEDGNPHVIWSASEDGTLRQHDLREGTVCPPNEVADHECRNVLLDLRSAFKRSLSDQPRHCLNLKTCAINRTRPHQLLVGGSDAFARLYDRRMLSPPSSSRMQGKPPPCICYLCPVHLSENIRSGLHLTHVTFSPNGLEVLLSYSGEHVYLMDVNNRTDDTITYMASDVQRRLALAPIVNNMGCSPTVINATKLSNPQLSECQELLFEGRKMLREASNHLYAIDIASEVLEAGGPVIDSDLQVECLCLRAEAFLKRLWKNDAHMAIRDCNKARLINPKSVQAHFLTAEALSHLTKNKEALEYAMRAQYLNPSSKEISDKIAALRAKLVSAEEAKTNGSADREATQGKEVSRVRTFSEILSRSEGDQGDLSPDSRRSERDDSDYDDDMEMEMEIEMLVGGEDERDRERETGARQGSSLNLRLRRRVTSSRERNCKPQSSSGMSNDSTPSQPEVALDMRQRYVGHCNIGTDIKQAAFLGDKGDYVASGSDDGRWFIWHKKTGRLLKLLKGDDSVVNCVQCHPFDCTIATSGIDNTIKMWTPCAQEPSLVAGGVAGPESADFLQIMGENQQKMRRPREIGFPLEILQRFRIPEHGMRPPLECTQS